MTQKILCAIALAAFAGAAASQGVVGRVTNVQGLVTVSDSTTVTSVIAGAPVNTGTRYVTSSTGTATIVVNAGGRECTVTLQPNQSFTLEPNRTCAQLVALVQTLPAAPGTAVAAVAVPPAAPAAAAGGAGFLPVLALLGAGAVLANSSGSSGPAGGGGGQLPNISGQ
ncbi:hypothetical protein [Caenimonas sp. SL110]|uniref:hypothetical protein n=1 Tax=Caenimonas sp. SL110 TaxID=1450524 RepID=UPI0006529E1B|nr:hypothetical protein [Caenimonas sp. SL110]